MARFRPELQGLRAVAVALVLGFHLAPGIIPGGFVGVDVFFVLSGFLITGMLTAEFADRGRVSVPGFLYRRARRLLPAAGVVLLATAIATVVLLPQSDWTRASRHIIAATLQGENWLLARESSDYLLSGTAGQAAQQFWTLSAEWQVYLGWAVLVAVVVLVSRRALAVVAGVVVLGSFAACVLLPSSFAYYATQSRAWEFVLGGLVALLAPRLPRFFGYLGLAAIAIAGVVLTMKLAYPGWFALVPALGAALVIATPPGWLGRRPLVWIGDRSYAIYLWHWPILVLFTALHGTPEIVGGIAILAATVAAATLTTARIEQPVRVSPRRGLVAVVVALAIVLPLAVGGVTLGMVSSKIRSLEEAGAPGYPGAAAIDPVDAALFPAKPASPDPLIAADDVGDAGDDLACLLATSIPVRCEFGDRTAARTLVVVGDSHAWQLEPLLDRFGTGNGWRVVTYVKPSCPLTPVSVAHQGVVLADCAEWHDAVMSVLTADPPDLVVVAALTPWGYDFSDYSTPSVRVQADGYEQYWARLAAAGIPIIAVKDTPYMAFDVPGCVASHPADLVACARPRAEVLHDDPIVLAQSEMPAVGLIDLTDGICRPTVCPAVVGNVLVYRDLHHLTATYSRTLEPLFAGELEALGY